MSYKPISLPPEDSQFLSTRQYGVEEICRIFNVPPHMVQDLQRSTFNNIEHQSIQFVKHSLMPWLVKIEMGIIKDLLVEDEQLTYFPKFNVDGMMRGDTLSRMNSYAVGINNGIYSVDEVRLLENLPPLPEGEGGTFHIINGSYTKLADVGKAYGANAMAEREKQEAASEDDSPPPQPDETEEQSDAAHEAPGHARRKAERKAERQGRQKKQ